MLETAVESVAPPSQSPLHPPLSQGGRRGGGLQLRVVLVAGMTGLCLAVAVESYRVLFGSNLHIVTPGRVYRCAQQSSEELEKLVRKYGIRTVINLRGQCAEHSWYLDECRATHRLDVSQEDIGLSAGRFPSMHELRRLVEVLDRTEYPILIHCRQGSDRTGLVAVVVLLLQGDVTLEQARQQMGLRYGHLALGRPANLDRFVDLYAGWLDKQGRSHSRTAFRDWLADETCPGMYRCILEPLDFPTRVPRDQPVALRLRAHNTGESSWRFRPGSNAGIHACYAIRDAEERCLMVGRAGLYDALVLPGQSIDLTLALPALAQPGRYCLFVDMLDEPHCIFYQTGSEPLEWEFTVDK